MSRARGRQAERREASSSPATPDADARPGRARRLVRRLGMPAVVVTVVVVAFVLGVFPTRTYLEKKQEIAAAEARLAELRDANTKADAHVQALQSDAEIERIAREQYGLAKPGEETYHVLPPPEPPVQIPDAWPFNQLRRGLPASPGHR